MAPRTGGKEWQEQSGDERLSCGVPRAPLRPGAAPVSACPPPQPGSSPRRFVLFRFRFRFVLFRGGGVQLSMRPAALRNSTWPAARFFPSAAAGPATPGGALWSAVPRTARIGPWPRETRPGRASALRLQLRRPPPPLPSMPPRPRGLSGLGGLAGAFSRPHASAPRAESAKSAKSAASAESAAPRPLPPAEAPGASASDPDAAAIVGACRKGAPPEAVREALNAVALWRSRVQAGAGAESGQGGQAALSAALASLPPPDRRSLLPRLGALLVPVSTDLACGLVQSFGAGLVDLLHAPLEEQADRMCLMDTWITTCTPSVSSSSSSAVGAANVTLSPVLAHVLRVPDLPTAADEAVSHSGSLWTLVDQSIAAGLPDASHDRSTALQIIRRLMYSLVVRSNALRTLIALTTAAEGPRVPARPDGPAPEPRDSDRLRAALKTHRASVWKVAQQYMKCTWASRLSVLNEEADEWVTSIPATLELVACELADLPPEEKHDLIIKQGTQQQPSQKSAQPLPLFLSLLADMMIRRRTPTTVSPTFYIPGFASAQDIHLGLSFDRPLQFLMAAILESLPAFPAPLGTEEDRQLERLRRLAGATSSGSGSSNSREEHLIDRAVRVRQAEARVEMLVSTGATKLVVALGRGPPYSQVASGTVGGRLGHVFDDLTRPTIKSLRTQMAGQGLPRAALSLANMLLPARSTLDGHTERVAMWKGAARAVTRFSITADPMLVWPSDRNPDALKHCLYLWAGHVSTGSTTGSEKLDLFESTLALTNFASHAETSPEVLASIAGFTPEGSDETAREMLVQRVLGEDDPRVRRACLELLINLWQDPATLQFVAGGTEALQQANEAFDKGEDQPAAPARTRQLVHLCAALCAPQGHIPGAGGETGLPVRMAASAVLAVASEMPTVCQSLLTLSPRTLRLLVHNFARFQEPGSVIQKGGAHQIDSGVTEIPDGVDPETFLAAQDDETDDLEDLKLDEEDLNSELNPSQARVGLAHRAGVALRGLANYVSCLPRPSQMRQQADDLLEEAGLWTAAQRVKAQIQEKAPTGLARRSLLPSQAEDALFAVLASEADQILAAKDRDLQQLLH